MKLEILQIPGCPHAALLEQRLDEALAGHTSPAERDHKVVDTVEAAAAVGMTGSPTLLVDGVDPFAAPGLAPSISCRLYPGEYGVQGAPSVAVLRHVLGTTNSGPYGDELGATTEESRDCCSVDACKPATTMGTGWQAQATPTDPGERTLHQAILRAFATTGCPPSSVELDQAAAPYAVPAEEILARLHAADIVRVGPDGQIRIAYPFSAPPTRHQVRLASGVEVFAMCAIDALGIPLMLGTDAVISTSDPSSGAPITVTAVADRFVWDPPTAVLFVSEQPVPSTETCCDYLNAFTDQDQANAWIQAHPHVPGEVVTPSTAELLGQKMFGDLLDHLV